MPRVVRLFVLGFMLVVQPSTLSVTPECTVRRPDWDEGDTNLTRNSFVNNDRQRCRPFVESHNPQVVRITHLLALPGRQPDTVIVQSQTCTGVVVGPRMVLTAKHCIQDDDGKIGNVIMGYVKTIEGEVYPVRLRSPDPVDDIMMLTVSEPMGIDPARISPQESLSTAPLSLQGYGCREESAELPLMRSGAARFLIENQLYLSGCICHGDSGGPVFDAYGRLVAVMVRTDNEGMTGRGVLVHHFLHAP